MRLAQSPAVINAFKRLPRNELLLSVGCIVPHKSLQTGPSRSEMWQSATRHAALRQAETRDFHSRCACRSRRMKTANLDFDPSIIEIRLPVHRENTLPVRFISRDFARRDYHAAFATYSFKEIRKNSRQTSNYRI